MNKRLTFLHQLIQDGKADAFAHYALAMEYKKEGQIAEATLAFDQLQAAFPDYQPQYLIAGQMFIDQNELDLAKKWLTKGLTLAQTSGDGKAAGEIQAALALC
jgi:tetratricopeptide (TPR) repeat protein